MSVFSEVVVPLLSALGGALIGGAGVLSFGWTLIFLKEPSVLENDLSEIKIALRDLSGDLDELKRAPYRGKPIQADGDAS